MTEPPLKKRKILTLEERINVIERNEKGETARKIAVSLSVGKTQIQNVIKDKESIRNEWQKGAQAQRKYATARRTVYGDLNERVWEWFCVARSKNIPVSGKLIQEKAIIVSAELNYDDFAASNGWLESFKNRYNITASVLSGESADVNLQTVDDWKKRLPTITEGYNLCDIFNADETGLFYRGLPDRSLVVKDDVRKGGKKAKERLTLLLACSATGEKLDPLIIGKSRNPRCFRSFNLRSVGVAYESNRKAWMTSDIFSKWLVTVNNKMKRKNRNILIIVDNCSAHPDCQFSNVKLVFLPPNTTSKLQPCDAGIIQTVKIHYRKKLLRHILSKMDECSTATEISKTVTVLDAILWIKSVWDALSSYTIERCFAKCGFSVSVEAIMPESDENEQDVHPSMEPLLNGMTLEEYANMDHSLETSNVFSGPDWEKDVLQRGKSATSPTADSDSDNESSVGEILPQVISHSMVIEHLKEIKEYALQHGDPKILLLCSEMEIHIQTKQLSKACQQRSIMDFFKKRE